MTPFSPRKRRKLFTEVEQVSASRTCPVVLRCLVILWANTYSLYSSLSGMRKAFTICSTVYALPDALKRRTIASSRSRLSRKPSCTSRKEVVETFRLLFGDEYPSFFPFVGKDFIPQVDLPNYPAVNDPDIKRTGLPINSGRSEF